MDSIQVGLLGADRSDDADIVLVSAAEDVYRLVRLSRALEERGIEKESGLSRSI